MIRSILEQLLFSPSKVSLRYLKRHSHGRMFSACFIFIYIFASSENLASHDFVSVEYSAVPLCTLIIPCTTEYEYKKNMNDGNMRT